MDFELNLQAASRCGLHSNLINATNVDGLTGELGCGESLVQVHKAAKSLAPESLY